MVKQVAAWEAKDGMLFTNRTAAAQHDATAALSTLGFKPDTIKHLLENSGAVLAVLKSIDTPDVRDTLDAQHG
jgi:Holliday junction resolvasome RuvABC DNA-binding subunit